MAGGKGETPPGEGELASDRCPSCGSLLTFKAGRAEGYCTVEGIFVEILRPISPASTRPPLIRLQVLNGPKRDLHDLCRAYGLKVSGNKTDLLTRLLRYMDERDIDLPPEEREEARETPALEVEPVPDAEEAPAEPPEVVPSLAVESVEREVPPAEVAFVPEAEATQVDALLGDIEAEEAHPETLPEPALETAVEGEVAVPGVGETGSTLEARMRRDRRIFYVGSILAATGGPGLILGSVLHDAFRVPILGRTYEAFGNLNVTFALIGGMLLLGGLVTIGVALRGGVVRATPSGV